MAETEEAIEETRPEETETKEEVEIDVNATLLEVMVERAMVLDSLMEGRIEISEAYKKLEEVGATVVEMLSPRRKRKR